MALYFYFNETTGDMVYSDQATYSGEGYVSLGEQTNMNPTSTSTWVFNSKRSAIKTVTKDPAISGIISGLKSMTSMFLSCSSLTFLDLSGFDTSQVASMQSLFESCVKISSLDLSGFDTSKTTDMGSMFKDCSSLTSLDLSGFDTSKVTNMDYMFGNCTSLISLDVSNFDTSKVMNNIVMFVNNMNLRLVSISGSMSNVLAQLPASQYYPAAGGSPVAKADLTAGTWVRDEADLALVATLVETAQAAMALRRKLTSLAKRVVKLESGV